MKKIKVGIKSNGKWQYQYYIVDSFDDFNRLSEIINFNTSAVCLYGCDVEKISIRFMEVQGDDLSRLFQKDFDEWSKKNVSFFDDS